MSVKKRNPFLSAKHPSEQEVLEQSPTKFNIANTEPINCQIDRLNSIIQSIMKDFQPIATDKILEKHTEEYKAEEDNDIITFDDFDLESEEKSESEDEELYSRIENLCTIIDREAMICEDYRGHEWRNLETGSVRAKYHDSDEDQFSKKIECSLYDIYNLFNDLQSIIDDVEMNGSYEGNFMLGKFDLTLSINHKEFAVPDKEWLAKVSSNNNSAIGKEKNSSDIWKYKAYISQLENEVEQLKLQIALPKEVVEFGQTLQDNLIESYKNIFSEEDFSLDLSKTTLDSFPEFSLKKKELDIKSFKQRNADNAKLKSELEWQINETQILKTRYHNKLEDMTKKQEYFQEQTSLIKAKMQELESQQKKIDSDKNLIQVKYKSIKEEFDEIDSKKATIKLEKLHIEDEKKKLEWDRDQLEADIREFNERKNKDQEKTNNWEKKRNALEISVDEVKCEVSESPRVFRSQNRGHTHSAGNWDDHKILSKSQSISLPKKEIPHIESEMDTLNAELEKLNSTVESLTGKEKSNAYMKINKLKTQLATLRSTKAISNSLSRSNSLKNIMAGLEKSWENSETRRSISRPRSVCMTPTTDRSPRGSVILTEPSFHESLSACRLLSYTPEPITPPTPESEKIPVRPANKPPLGMPNIMKLKKDITPKAEKETEVIQKQLKEKEERIKEKEIELNEREIKLQNTWMKIPNADELIPIVQQEMLKIQEMKTSLELKQKYMDRDQLILSRRLEQVKAKENALAEKEKELERRESRLN